MVKKKKNFFALSVIIFFLVGFMILPHRTEAASVKRVCKAYKQYLAKNQENCKYFRIVRLKGSDIPVLMTSEEVKSGYGGLGFCNMATAYTYKNKKVKEVGKISVGKELLYYLGSFYSLVVHGFEKGWMQKDEIILESKNTTYNSEIQSYESEININWGNSKNSQRKKITETQNQNLINVYRKSKQIKPYKNTKTGRKKCTANNIIGKGYQEVSELLITDINILAGKKDTILIENKIKNAKYEWNSKNESVATVTQEGVVTGVSGGDTVITCKVTQEAKTYSLKCNVYVIDYSEEAVMAHFALEKDGYIYSLDKGSLARTGSTAEDYNLITENAIISEDGSQKFILYGSYLYFLKKEEGGEQKFLTRVDMKGKKEEILCRANSLYGVDDGKIYYDCFPYLTDEEESQPTLRYITVDGMEYGEYEGIHKYEYYLYGKKIIVKDGYLYDTEIDGSLSRFDLNTGETEILVNKKVTRFQIVGNCLYYSGTISGEWWRGNAKSGIYKMDLTSKAETEIYSTETGELFFASIDDNYIYYWINGIGTHKMNRVRLDGTENNQIFEVKRTENSADNFIHDIGVFGDNIVCTIAYFDGYYYSQECTIQVYRFNGSSWDKTAEYEEKKLPVFDYARGKIFYNDSDDFAFSCVSIDLNKGN